jgi:hypothetical protein
MLAAACACGVAGTFGSPLGGVLFSVETTSTYYPLRNYWFAFIAATTSGILSKVLSNIAKGKPELDPFLTTQFANENTMKSYEFFIFCAMGVIGGIIGSLCVIINTRWIKFRRAHSDKWRILGPFPYAFTVAFITGALTLVDDTVGLGGLAAMQDLFRSSSLVPYGPGKLNVDWGSDNIYLSLTRFILIRLFLFIITLSVPVPMGSVNPILATGAAFGRLLGEAVNAGTGGASLSPGVYAMIGAVAMTAGTTHTINISIIMFEMTGKLSFALPMFASVLISKAVASKLSLSIFDSISLIRGLPFLDDLQTGSVSLTAKDIMDKNVGSVLPQKCTMRELKDFLQRYATTDNFRQYTIPVVDTEENRLLLGSTNYESLLSFITKMQYALNKEKEEQRAILEQENRTADMQIMYEKMLYKQKRKKIKLLNKLKDLITTAPIHFEPETPLTQVHLLFISMRLHNGFVTKHGKLIGTITRRALQQAITQHNSTVFQL